MIFATDGRIGRFLLLLLLFNVNALIRNSFLHRDKCKQVILIKRIFFKASNLNNLEN